MTNRLLPFLSLVAAIGIFFAYISPLWNGQIADTKAAIADDDRALKSAAAYVKRENELAAEVNAIDPDALARLETFLPDSVDNVGLILDLYALADRSGIVLSSIDVAGSGSGSAAPGTTNSADTFDENSVGAANANPVGTIDMTLAAKGTYDAMLEFLSGIEYSERLLDLRELSVSGSDTGVYNYQMTIRLYWLR